MIMKIFNTLTNKLEEFTPITPGVVNMYVCGPTVYNYAHVGNMYPVIVFDMVYRYLKYKGYKVNYASNFTDVDDKIIKAALELSVTEKEITDKFIQAYLEELEALQCEQIDYRPRVTETMDSIIAFISLLLEKDYAYKSGEDVYFRVSKISDYGCLSKQNLEALDYGKRIDVADTKENPFDFVLWKKTNEGITWDAPFGTGRPGWHTECVVMIHNIFNGKIDIHGGGVDLKFPHHENEMAQSKAAWNHNLANYWMHNGHIMVEGEKMSKSLNNFILAKDLRKDYPSNAIRLAFLKNQYRAPLDLTKTTFSECVTINDKIYNALKQANINIQMDNISVGNLKKDKKIEEIMDNDFNTPNLITYLLDLIKELNTSIRNNTDISQTYDKIILINSILGLEYELKEFSDKDKELYQEWLTARENKDFQKADTIREQLVSLNIL